MSAGRLLPVFSVAFAVIYVTAMYFNLGPIDYFPRVNQWAWRWGDKSGLPAPAMYWYGWLVTASVGAAGVALLAAALPARVVPRLWSGFVWAVPVAAVLVVFYILRPWFLT